MIWQIVSKAVFTEYEDVQTRDANGAPVFRTIPSAIYRYYLIRSMNNKYVSILEQEHWTGEFVGISTSPLNANEGMAAFTKMKALETDPSRIDETGIPYKTYEKSESPLDVLESDFGLLELSDEHIPAYEDTTVGSSPLNQNDSFNRPAFSPVKTPQPSFQPPQQQKQGMVVSGYSNPSPGTPRVRQVGSAPMGTEIPSRETGDEYRDEIIGDYDVPNEFDNSSLPSAPYLPEQEDKVIRDQHNRERPGRSEFFASEEEEGLGF